jgi:AraC-like DNA-binding protein
MGSLDHAARFATIGILAVMAIVLGRSRRGIPSATAGIAFFLTVSAHFIVSTPGYVPTYGLDAGLTTAALVAPGAFFLFSRALFDDERSFTGLDATIGAVLVGAGWTAVLYGRGLVAVPYYVTSIVLVVLALRRVVAGLPSDLVEPRRTLRAVFTGVVGVCILLVLAVEVVLGGQRPAPLLETAKSAGALAIAAAFGAWILMPRRELFALEPVAAAAIPQIDAVADPASDDHRHRDRLLLLMRRERVYRQEGLTIGRLAQTLEVPEYRLRRIINQQLGYRNFNAFLNDLRVEEACQVLADPAQETLPILNLALDLGYGSSGPFNRAFRTKTGLTPTEYRRNHLQRAIPTGD